LKFNLSNSQYFSKLNIYGIDGSQSVEFSGSVFLLDTFSIRNVSISFKDLIYINCEIRSYGKYSILESSFFNIIYRQSYVNESYLVLIYESLFYTVYFKNKRGEFNYQFQYTSYPISFVGLSSSISSYNAIYYSLFNIQIVSFNNSEIIDQNHKICSPQEIVVFKDFNVDNLFPDYLYKIFVQNLKFNLTIRSQNKLSLHLSLFIPFSDFNKNISIDFNFEFSYSVIHLNSFYPIDYFYFEYLHFNSEFKGKFINLNKYIIFKKSESLILVKSDQCAVYDDFIDIELIEGDFDLSKENFFFDKYLNINNPNSEFSNLILPSSSLFAFSSSNCSLTFLVNFNFSNIFLENSKLDLSNDFYITTKNLSTNYSSIPHFMIDNKYYPI
jgi:hypothetical protein